MPPHTERDLNATICAIHAITLKAAIKPMNLRDHCAPRIRKMLATAPAKYNRHNKIAKNKPDPMLGLSEKMKPQNCQSIETPKKLQSASHSMPRMRCIFINAKSPNF